LFADVGGLTEKVAGTRAKRRNKMSQALKERKSGQSSTAARRRRLRSTSAECLLEIESRLKREDDDARWKRQKEMIIVGSVAYVSLGSFTVLAVALLSGAYPSTDKVILIGFITQLLTNLLLYMRGNTPKFKK
jgi:hypothetical protein